MEEMDVKADRNLRRTDLFLVRMWTQDASDGSGTSEWHGRVQRVVDGESRQFDNWQTLVAALSAMLSAEDGRTPIDYSPADPQNADANE
jgi:hypothetical protein